MGQRADWIIERELAFRRPGRLVKVVTAGDERARATRYITTGGHMLGRTAREIRKALGLNIGDIEKEIRIYKLTRPPYFDEYEYELTAKYPDGLSYNPLTDEQAKYPEGRDRIPQWRILEEKSIPVDPDFVELALSSKLTYEWLLK